MSHSAQHRDITDPQVTADFCDLIENLDTLNMLYLLTYVDMASVSPESMNEWKNNLLWQLYRAAREFFISDGSQDTTESSTVLSRKEEVTKRLVSFHGRAFISNHLNALPPSYLMYQSTKQIRQHLDALNEFDGTKPVIDFAKGPDQDNLDMIVVWNDRVGLFHKICTAVLLENFSIIEARLNTRQDGLAIDNILIRDALNADEPISDSRKRLLQERLERILANNDAPPLVAKQPKQPALGRNRIDTQVNVINDITMRYTILEIRCADRRGLLQGLTGVIYAMNLSIHFARIITEGNKVTDIFYISDTNGNKITDKNVQKNLKEELQETINPALQNA